LKASWDFPTIYVNPPFGKTYLNSKMEALSAKEYKNRTEVLDNEKWVKTDISDWVRRCQESSLAGSQVIALLPAAVDTKYWHQYIFGKATAACFLKGRIRFVGAPAAAPMACSLVYWGGSLYDNFVEAMSSLGYVVKMNRLE
jgi:hypothetical protein